VVEAYNLSQPYWVEPVSPAYFNIPGVDLIYLSLHTIVHVAPFSRIAKMIAQRTPKIYWSWLFNAGHGTAVRRIYRFLSHTA